MINKIKAIISRYKITFITLSVILGIVLIIFLSSKKSVEKIPVTTPILPTSSLSPTPTSILEASPLSNPKQTITINWNDLNIDSYQSIPVYQITTPLINTSTIKRIATSLGFKDTDIKATLKSNNYRWSTAEESFFASIPQGQMFYTRSQNPNQTKPSLDKNTITSTVNEYLNTLLGAKAVSLLSTVPEYRYFVQKTDDITGIKVTTSTPDKATIYEVAYKQQIKGAPIVALSGSSDILTIGIDRDKKIYHLSVFGGIEDYQTSGTRQSISTDELKKNAISKARRITAAGDVSADESYASSDSLHLSVEKIQLAYLQENLSLFPVYLLHVSMSGPKLAPVSAIYSVPATK